MERVPFDSPVLIDRTGQHRLATTDPSTFRVYLTDSLDGKFLETVLIHEIGHCLMVSYDLLHGIRMIIPPEHWITAEEWLCNYLATYGRDVFDAASSVLGYEVRRRQ